MTDNAVKFAQRFHETVVSLAPSFDVKRQTPWDRLPENRRKLHTAAARLVLREFVTLDDRALAYLEKMAQCPTGQDIEFDRNLWQRRLGVLLTLIQETAAHHRPRKTRGGTQSGDGLVIAAMNRLEERAYAAVNVNPFTGNEDGPWSSLSMKMVRHTLEAALQAGIVAPGDNAPDWMLHAHPPDGEMEEGPPEGDETE